MNSVIRELFKDYFIECASHQQTTRMYKNSLFHDKQ